jgi:DNA-binding IclR family transcriptional regulator
MHVDALEITRKAMAGLLARSGNHNIFLSVWGNHGPVIILRNDGREAYPFAVQIGTVLPVLRSATGNIYLTYLPPAVTQKSVEREIDNSRRNSGPNRRFPWGMVNQIITEVQKRGIAKQKGREPGVIALAAPVFDYAFSLRCVITILGEASNKQFNYNGQGTKDLLATADLISSQIGLPEKFRREQREFP